MKVLQVLYSGLGGHGSVATSLIEADATGKWKHALLFYGIEELLPAYKEFCERTVTPYSYVQKKRGLFNNSGKAIKAAILSHNPDVIIIHSPHLVFALSGFCKKYKKKLLVVEHTSNDVKRWPELLAGIFSLLSAHKVIYLSLAYQQQMKKKCWFIPVEKRSVVIQNGIDLQKFKPEVKQQDILHTGMIGRFIHPKNQKMIVEALEKGIQSGLLTKRMIIHFAGNGNTLAALQSEVKKKNMDELVRFHGLLDEKEIIEFLGQLGFYVHASYAETMCTAVMQAMACGLPVVASNIPGINNIVEENENAILFNNDDINTLVKGMAVMQDDVKRKEMGNHARAYSLTHFSSADTFNGYNELIHAV